MALKLIISEVDGILTEGKIIFDEIGNTIFKEFNLKDFDAINELQKTFKVVFLAKDNRISYNLFRSRNTPFFWAAGKPKIDILSEIMHRYNVTPDEIAYIGCSFSDIACMKLATLRICPSDAIHEIKNLHNVIVLNAKGGKGVFCELYTYLINSNDYLDEENDMEVE